jgi:hypothetical protein
MDVKATGLTSTTELRLPSGELASLFKLTDEGNLIVQNEALAKLILEKAKLPEKTARAETEVTVSVTVKF